MRVYLAGGSTERLSLAKPYIARLRDVGITITHDWTETEDWNLKPPGDPGDSTGLADERRAHHARADLDAVGRADLVWLLVPEVRSEGAMVEFGAALAARKHVVVSGPHRRRSIFTALAAEHYDDHEDAYFAIVSRLAMDGSA